MVECSLKCSRPWLEIPVWSPKTLKIQCAASLLGTQHLCQTTGVRHAVLSLCQPLSVAFTLLANLCRSKANATEIGAARSTKAEMEGDLISTCLRRAKNGLFPTSSMLCCSNFPIFPSNFPISDLCISSLASEDKSKEHLEDVIIELFPRPFCKPALLKGSQA